MDDLEAHDYTAAASRAAETIDRLGHDVAKDEGALSALLPELIRGNSNGKAVGFGNGLAMGAEKPREMWSAMVTQVAAAEDPSVELLCGFFGGLAERRWPTCPHTPR